MADLVKKIKRAAICFKAKANEIIDVINRPWTVEMPDTQFGVASVKQADNKNVIDLSQLSTITFVACDEDGNQKTVTCLGFSGDDV